MARLDSKRQRLARRRKGVRKRMLGTATRPRLAVFRSLRHIYAQIINDLDGRTLIAASSANTAGGNREAAAQVGKTLAERATGAGIKQVVFDRGGYRYHGRVRALAEAAREGGLEF